MNHKLKILTVFLFFISNVCSAQWQSPIKYERNRFYPILQVGGIPSYLAAGVEYEKNASPFGMQFLISMTFAKSKNTPSDFQKYNKKLNSVGLLDYSQYGDYAYSPTALATYQTFLFNTVPVKFGLGLSYEQYLKAEFGTYTFFEGKASSNYQVAHIRNNTVGLIAFARMRPFQKSFRSLNIFAQINLNRYWSRGTLGLQFNIRKFKNDNI